MDVNKIKIRLPESPQEILVPLDMQWDLLNREDSIIEENKKIVKKVIGVPPNYELVRFSRRPIAGITEQIYQFYFYSASTDNWLNTYFTRFTQDDVRFQSNAYKKSFFKLDFYDKTEPQTQRIYLTVILGTYQSAIDFFATLGVDPPTLPCIQYRISTSINYENSFTYIDCCGETQIWQREPGGVTTLDFCAPFDSTLTFNYSFEGDPQPTETFVLNGDTYDVFNDLQIFELSDTCECDLEEAVPANSYIIYKPQFNLDHVGETEGYYLYWYEDPTLLNINEFYMKAKFFDGARGTYTVFTVYPQSNYGSTKYTVPNDDFYVRVPLNYSNRSYEIIEIITNNVLTTCPWYEYVNPPLT
jgi:hypothetical protein